MLLLASIAMDFAPPMNCDGYVSTTVKSVGCVARLGWNGPVAFTRPYSALTPAAGLCAILIAAVAVSVGCAAELLIADVLIVEQDVDVADAELMHEARMLPSVFSSDCGTVPPPVA